MAEMSDLNAFYEGSAYFRRHELFFRDCDDEKDLKPSVLVSMFVDNAGKDYTGKGFSHDIMQQHNQAFLLSRIRVEIKQMPHIDSVVTVFTCERSVKGPLYIRDFAMYDENNNTLAEATSDWLLVDIEKRRILRPSEFFGEVTQNEKKISCKDCEKLSAKNLDLKPIATRKVYHSDLDANGHLYSARYVDLVLDSIEVVNPKSIEINYKKELRLGDTLQLFCAEGDNSCVVVGMSDEIERFICRIGL